MAKENPSVILLRGDPLYGEASASAAITPGMLLTTTGGARTATNDPQATPAGVGAVAPIFARENDVVGKGINDSYAPDDNVLFMHLRRGDWAYALLAAGQNVAAGANLSAGAGGYLTATTEGAPVIARALVATESTEANSRIKVEVV